MNQDTIFQILLVGMLVFSLLTVIWTQFKRIKHLEEMLDEMVTGWQAWSASKLEDYSTSRIMAAIARAKTNRGESAGVQNPVLSNLQEPKEVFTIKQTAG